MNLKETKHFLSVSLQDLTLRKENTCFDKSVGWLPGLTQELHGCFSEAGLPWKSIHICVLVKLHYEHTDWILGAHREVLKSWPSIPYPQMPGSPKVYKNAFRPTTFHFFEVFSMKETNNMLGPHPHGHIHTSFTQCILLGPQGWHSRNVQNKITFCNFFLYWEGPNRPPFPTKETEWFNNSVALKIVTFEV